MGNSKKVINGWLNDIGFSTMRKLNTPILNYHFKSVRVDWIIYFGIYSSRERAGLVNYPDKINIIKGKIK